MLSSTTPGQFYGNPIQSGLANMSWDELTGTTMSVCGTLTNTAADTRANVSDRHAGAGPQWGAAGSADGQSASVMLPPTTGTTLVLNFAEAMQLAKD